MGYSPGGHTESDTSEHNGEGFVPLPVSSRATPRPLNLSPPLIAPHGAFCAAEHSPPWDMRREGTAMFPSPGARLCVWDVLISMRRLSLEEHREPTQAGTGRFLGAPLPPASQTSCASFPARGLGTSMLSTPWRFAGQPGLCVDLLSLIRPVPVVFDMKIIGDTTQLIHKFENESGIMSRL